MFIDTLLPLFLQAPILSHIYLLRYCTQPPHHILTVAGPPDAGVDCAPPVSQSRAPSSDTRARPSTLSHPHSVDINKELDEVGMRSVYRLLQCWAHLIPLAGR